MESRRPEALLIGVGCLESLVLARYPSCDVADPMDPRRPLGVGAC